jgi:putative ABC transport system permease protein
MIHLIIKNLLRNKRRAFLTWSGVAVSLFLLASLAVVYSAMGEAYRGADVSPRLMVRRSVGLTMPLPERYADRIRQVPGVEACSTMLWTGGYWKEPQNTFAAFGIDPENIFKVLDVARIPPPQLATFQRERTAAVAGRQLATQFGWKVGDRITLLGSSFGQPVDFTLRGIYTGGPEDQFYFHYDYWNESVGRPNLTGLFWVRVEKPEIAARIGQAIDAMFRNTEFETKTESEGTFLLGFISMLGNVRALVLMIGAAVTFAILLIVANTMAMSIRERIPEAAILRTLGFRSAQIMQLFVGESLALTLLGALVGVGGAKLLYDSLALSKIGPMVWADLRMRPAGLAFCVGLSLAIGLAASGWSAWRAARAPIADALRSAG